MHRRCARSSPRWVHGWEFSKQGPLRKEKAPLRWAGLRPNHAALDRGRVPIFRLKAIRSAAIGSRKSQGSAPRTPGGRSAHPHPARTGAPCRVQKSLIVERAVLDTLAYMDLTTVEWGRGAPRSNQIEGNGSLPRAGARLSSITRAPCRKVYGNARPALVRRRRRWRT